MTPSSATQDYIKAITSLTLNSKKNIIKPSSIAKRLTISSAAVNDMVKKLVKDNLLITHAYKGVELTASGLKLGKKLIRYHRLWEVFLHQVLDVGWEDIHKEAELLEHAASDSLMNKIDAYLNYPKSDPHGNPIPDINGHITLPKNEQKLSTCKHNQTYKVTRFSNFDATYLDFLSKSGLALGSTLSIVQQLSFDQSYICYRVEKENKIIFLNDL